MQFTELQITTNFSFLRGASHAEEFAEQASFYKYKQFAITDRNSFAGIVRAHVAAKTKNLRLIVGVRLDLLDGPSLLAYPTDTESYSMLSSLLTKGNLRAEKGECHLYKSDVYEHSKNLKFIVVPPAELNEVFDFDASFRKALNEYREAFSKHIYLAATRHYT